MFHRHMILPIVTQALVKGSIFLVSDVLRLPHPQRLVFVQLLPFMGYLFYLLRFFFLLLLLLFLIHFFDLWFVTFLSLFVFLLLLFLGVRDLLLFGLFHVE